MTGRSNLVRANVWPRYSEGCGKRVTTTLANAARTAQEGESRDAVVVSATHMAHAYSPFGLL